VGIKTNGFWLQSLSKYYQNGLPTDNLLNFEARLQAATPALLTGVANKYLSSKNILHAMLMPE
jgi:predicted Zn-dependent peptidase